MLAPIRLHHEDILSFFSLEWLSRTLPINTRLKTTFKGFNTKTKSLPRSNLVFCAGAPSLLSPHSPHISYDRRSTSNAPEHRPKSTTYTTIKRPCSSGREPDGRDKFLSRPQSFD
ncbi:unnamed protein product [Prunus brigantina]